MLTQAEIKQLVQRIVDYIHPGKVILFGSYAKGSASIKSDLDLLVIKATPLPLPRRAAELTPFLSNSLVPVDVHIYTPEEVEEYTQEKFSFLNTILTYGKTVYSE